MKKKKQIKSKTSKSKTEKKSSSPLSALLKKVQTANSFDQNHGYCDGYSSGSC